MHADCSSDVAARVEAGATVPVLGWIATWVLTGGLLLLLLAAGARSSGRCPSRFAPPGD
jgi:hypothetical protein